MFYIASDKSFQWYQSKPQLIMDFELLFHISMCAEIYSLYVMIDIFDILIVFINSEKWRTIKDCVVIDIYIWCVDCSVPVRFPYSWVVRHSAIVTSQIVYYVFQYQYSWVVRHSAIVALQIVKYGFVYMWLFE